MDELETYMDNEFKSLVDDDILQLVKSAFAESPEDRPQDIQQFRDKAVKITKKRKKALNFNG
jgi:hypothetical protein